MSDLTPTPRPEPVIDEAKVTQKVTAGLTALLTLAALGGFLSADQVPAVVTVLVTVAGAVFTAINFIVPIVRARVARDKVTPLASPRAADGKRLVPFTVANRAASQQIALDGDGERLA